MDLQKYTSNPTFLLLLFVAGVCWLPFLYFFNITIQSIYFLAWPSYLGMSVFFLIVSYKLSSVQNAKINLVIMAITLISCTAISYLKDYTIFNYSIPILTALCTLLLLLDSSYKALISRVLLIIIFAIFFCGIFASLPTTIYVSITHNIEINPLLHLSHSLLYCVTYLPSVLIAMVNIINSKPNKQIMSGTHKQRAPHI
jgi:hypothetical protein